VEAQKANASASSYLGLSHATSLSYREAALFGPCGSIISRVALRVPDFMWLEEMASCGDQDQMAT
jgi:hypothetical protein